MTISETAVPAAGSHPYPDPHPDAVMPEGDDWPTIADRLEASWRECRPSFTAMAQADFLAKLWNGVPGRMYKDMRAPDGWITGTAPDPKLRRSHAADTKPDQVRAPAPAAYLPSPRSLPLPEPESGPDLTRRQRRLFGRTKPAAPLRDQPPVVTEPAWHEPAQGTPRGKHAAPEAPDSAKGTTARPVAAGQDAPTLKPGELSTEEVRRAIEAADEIQRQSASALERAGAKPADLAHLARPGDGRDAAEQVTAVIQRPADQGERDA